MDREGQYKTQRQKDAVESYRHGLQVAKGISRVGKEIYHGHTDSAVLHAISLSSKLATSLFYKNEAPVIELFKELTKLGPGVLVKAPESLYAFIDKTYGKYSQSEANDAIEHFHRTGELKTDVPPVVRNKIYAIRTTAISDAPYSEWNIFEKVGGAFNGRVVNFSHVEPLSAGECAATVALMDYIRHDDFTNEIKIYVALCCFESGIYSVKGCHWLSFAQDALQDLVYQNTGEPYSSKLSADIEAEFKKLVDNPKLVVDDSTIAGAQAGKLFAAHRMAEDALAAN